MVEFDFCPNTRVAEELAPDAPKATSMNGWDFTAKPAVPYRPMFKVTLEGLYWHLDGGRLDITKDPAHNAGRLRNFYIEHLTWGKFLFNHEYLGMITCRFHSPVNLPKALPSAGGLLSPLEVTLVQHNPGYVNA